MNIFGIDSLADPLEAKKRLSMSIVARFHGIDAAAKARIEWDKRNSRGKPIDLAKIEDAVYHVMT